MIRRVLRSLTLAVAGTVIVAGLSSTPAQAANYKWDGMDPYATECGYDGVAVDDATVTYQGREVVYVWLIYSRACRTTWAEVAAASGYSDWSAKGYIHRNQDGKRLYLSYVRNNSSGGVWVRYTPMVNDAGMSSYAAATYTGPQYPWVKTRSY
jgi:hypothetical protein